MNLASSNGTLKTMEHLSEFDLDEVLIGEVSPGLEAHLHACAACSGRLAALQQPIASFRSASLAWAEQRSAAMPLPPALAASTQHLTAHLTDDQLDDVLIEGASAATDLHLAACTHCTQRLEALGQPIASFREMSLAWSERRSATMPLKGEHANSTRWTTSWTMRYGWVAATAAVVAVLVAIPLHFGAADPAGQSAHIATPPAHTASANTQTASIAAPRPSTAPQPSADDPRRQQQIEADNQMLAGIDRELDASQATLAAFGVNVSPSGLPTHNRGSAKHGVGRPEQD